MGWERRKNGLYYYHKVRIGHRVVSEYCGTGEIGRLSAELYKIGRPERKPKQVRDDRQKSI